MVFISIDGIDVAYVIISARVLVLVE
jgi:hypothetical protein